MLADSELLRAKWVWTDQASLAICGFIGSHWMIRRSRVIEGLDFEPIVWLFLALASALVTAFGGGTYAALVLQSLFISDGKQSYTFAWQQPQLVTIALLGGSVPIALNSYGFLDIFEASFAFELMLAFNMGVLVSWGVCLTLVRTRNWTAAGRFVFCVPVTFLYASGGGATRDLVASHSVGALGAANLQPLIVSIPFLAILEQFQKGRLIPVIGIPVSAALFFLADRHLDPTMWR